MTRVLVLVSALWSSLVWGQAFNAQSGVAIKPRAIAPIKPTTHGVIWLNSADANKPYLTYPDLTSVSMLSGGGGGTVTADSPLTGNGSSGSHLACPTCVTTSRTVNTTTPLGGGGALSSNLTLTCATCVTTARSVATGNGLSGGGDLSADRTLVIDTSITVDKTTAQTLTNKTLTSPSIGGTITGSYSIGGAPTLTSTNFAVQSDLGPTVGDATHRLGDVFGTSYRSGASSLSLITTLADGPTGVAGIIDTSATWSNAAARLWSFRNNGTEKLGVFQNGSLTTPSLWSLTSTAVSANATGLTLTTNVADGATTIGLLYNSAATLSNAAARLLSLQNNSAEKLGVLADGTLVPTGNVTITAGKFVNVATSSATVPPAITKIAVTFLNSWVNLGAPYRNCAYYKDALGYVHLEGVAKNGTATAAVFQLPAGYRPTATLFFAGAVNNAFAQINVDSSGNVSSSVAGNASIVFDGIAFYAEQ